MTDLERFEQRCKQTGDYQALDAIERFRQYEANMKALEGEVLRERAKLDE
jgi:hypothetical protein